MFENIRLTTTTTAPLTTTSIVYVFGDVLGRFRDVVGRLLGWYKFGICLGGLLSCYAGQTRSNIYDYAGCMSSSFWWNNKDFNSKILRNGTTKTRSSSAFYLDSGNEGPGKDDEAETIAVRQSMEKLGKKLNKNLFYYLDNGGSHNELFWGKRFFRPMLDFYRQ